MDTRTRNIVVGVAAVVALGAIYLVANPGSKTSALPDITRATPQKFVAKAGATTKVDWSFPSSLADNPQRLYLKPIGTGQPPTTGNPKNPGTTTYPIFNADWELDIYGLFIDNTDIPYVRHADSQGGKVTTYDFATDTGYTSVLLQVVVTRM